VESNENVDLAPVIDLEYDAPGGVADVIEGPLLEVAFHKVGCESDWSPMEVSKSKPKLSQTSSRSVAFIVRTKRHWFLYSSEFPESSLDLKSSISSGSGPPLISNVPDLSHIWNSLSPVGLNFRWKSCTIEFANVVISHDVALSQPMTSRTSPFLASRPRMSLTYLYQFSTLEAT